MKQGKGMIARLTAHFGTALGAEFLGLREGFQPVAGKAKAHAAFWFVIRATGTGDASDRDSKVGMRMPQGTIGHFTGGLFRHRAMGLKGIRGYAKLLFFRFI